MFRNLSNIFLTLIFVLIGMTSAVFGVSFSQILDQMKADVFRMGDLFEGKAVVSNIYKKALKYSKDQEIAATTVSLEGLKEVYPECVRATSQDFINILYNSNVSFRETFKQILPESIKRPTSREIDASYDLLLACKGLSRQKQYIDMLNTEINRKYYELYTNAYALSVLDQDNYGSDLFWNGTLDDSPFDLLYDINRIGTLLFEEFKESPQLLFYRMPTVQSVTTRAGGGLSSLTDQSAYQVGGGGPLGQNPMAISSSSQIPLTSSVAGVYDSSSSSSLAISQPFSFDDLEIQQFISSTRPSLSSSSAGSPLILGHQCLSGSSEDAPVFLEEQPTLATAEQYMAAINDFIDRANTNQVVQQHLLDAFSAGLGLASGQTTSSSGMLNTIANTYAEQAFGDAQPGICAYGCNGLPLDKQVACQLQCIKSCIQQCKKIAGIQERALCVSDCTCFMVAGPKGAGWEKVEDMFRIKFCKVPSQTKKVMPGKKVFSIQAIFQEILDVLEGLKDSGEMVIFSKRKEFLDGNIKITLADNFAFKVLVGFKPVFPQQRAAIKISEQTQNNADLNLRVLNLSVTAPEADDYNKYLVVSDPLKNKANLQQATSLADIEENIKKFTDVVASSTQASDQTVALMRKTAVQQNSILMINNIISFLQDNYAFRNNFIQVLLDINKKALELKANIEAVQ